MSLSTSVQVQRLPISAIGNKAIDANAILPIELYVKNVTVLTSGAPADIATITVPAGITRWMVCSAANLSTVIAETAAGSLVAGQFQGYDAAAAGGNNLIGTTSLPSGTTGTASRVSIVGIAATATQAWSTSSTLYIRQTANSANAGTVSFYITIFPMP